VIAGLDSAGRIELTGEAVSLRAGVPTLNGVALEGPPAEVVRHREDFTARYRLPDGGEFVIEARNSGEPGWLRYGLEGFSELAALDSFGLHFHVIENVRAFLRQGYQSWDGSYYVDAGSFSEGGQAVTGYAMTQLLPRDGDGKLILGFDRHDRFQHSFTFQDRTLALTVETHWDRKEGAARCSSERLLFFTHVKAEEGLRAWARQVAAASPTPPRLPGSRLTGWCSWYNLYASITEENLREHLESTARACEQEGLPMRIFQVDDGFTPEMGDWLAVKPEFPSGMKALLEEIRAAGFTPGLWIAPFMVGNRSRMYREHPDWVVRDRETGGPLVQATFYGELRWHKRSEEYYILDATHPQAFDYLRQVFHTWRQDWGCEYFKTDFMFYGGEHGPLRAVWHKPGMTRIEVWRKVAEMIRGEIGEALWLGCGCPLWASVGLVDAVRIGRDAGARWATFGTIERLRDTATRNFAGGILWQGDPDAVLLRERFHNFTEDEVESLAFYAGLTSGVLMTSDDLGELSPDRLALWKSLLGLNPGRCDFPLLEASAAAYTNPGGESRWPPAGTDPVLVQVLSGPETELVFCFNLGSQPARPSYPLTELGLSAPKYVLDWPGGRAADKPVHALDLALPPHAGWLVLLSDEPWLR
jgi:hypothetical protein